MNQPFNGAFQPWQTGGNPAAQPTATAAYAQWPPATLGNLPAANLPTYTATASIITLSGPVVTNGVNGVDGWYDKSDTTPMVTPIAGCKYPDAYNAATLAAPSGPVCGPGAVPVPTEAAITTASVRSTTTEDPRGAQATTIPTTAATTATTATVVITDAR